MKLGFYGAARTVTGSQYVLSVADSKVLVDCGMFQGSSHMRNQNRMDFHLNPVELDCVLVTHAHIDHCGLLPRLVASGFKGDIVTTEATADLLEVMLMDSAHIQEEDAKYDLQKWQKHGRVGPPPQPLYTAEDVGPALALVRAVPYEELTEAAGGVQVRFRDAGHIIGSALLEVWANEDNETRKIVFSGDLGRDDQVLLRDVEEVTEADFLVTESTYGNRIHPDIDAQSDRFAEIVREVIERKGHLVIPAFAVGRSQAMLYALNLLVEGGHIPVIPVFLDSPMAIRATEIVRKHRECFDADALALLAHGDQPTEFPGLSFSRSVAESKAINDVEGPCIIISASGMCTAGRIRHHLRNHLPHANDTVLIVGFQAAGTLGQILQSGVEQVKLFSRNIPVNATIETLSGFSAHADLPQMLKWTSKIRGLRNVFVCHGEEEAALDYTATLHRRLGLDTYAPEAGFVADLLADDPFATVRDEVEDIWLREPSEADVSLG